MRFQQQHGFERCRSITFIFGRAGAAALLALISLALSQSRSYAIDIDALVGFGQSTSSRSLYRPETATPLTVYLTGSGIRGDGQLQVTVRSNEHNTTYTRKVSLQEGAIKEARAEGFVFQLEPAEFRMGRGSNTTEINVQLLVDGRQVAHKTIALPLSTAAESYNVLALTRNGSGLNFLQAKKMGLFHRHTNPAALVYSMATSAAASPNGINPGASLYVAYTRPDALPVMEQGYDMMDAVALADMPLDNLTDAQVSALKGYVRNGGLLIVSGGGDLSRLKSPFYVDMLPISTSGSTSVTGISALTSRYRELLPLAAPLSLVTGSLKPGASVLLQQSPQLPLVIRRAYGAGAVVLTAFDYLDPAIRGWSAAPSLWRDLLRTGNEAVSPRGILTGTTNAGNNADALADALAGSRASNTPQFYTVAIFLTAYLVLLIPVSYFVLKRLDKREMAWYTAPILIASFTLISYLIALSIKGGSLNMNRVVVLESQSGSDQYAGYAMMTLYSPRRSNYDISVGDSTDTEAAHDVAPDEAFRGQTLTSDMTVEQNGSTILRNLPIGLWDKRSFDLPVSASLGGAVDAAVNMTGSNSAQVTVTNHTRYSINGCGIVNADRFVPIGDLPSGESRQVPVKLAYGANTNTLKLWSQPNRQSGTTSNDPNQETPEAVRTKLRNAVIQALGAGDQNNNNYMYNYGRLEGNFGQVPNVVVGWIDGQLFHPTVNGRVPSGAEADFICVHLPTSDRAPRVIATGTNPFLTEPVLNLEDDLGPGAARGGRRMMRGNE